MKRTLENVVYQRQSQGQDSKGGVLSFNTFLTIYSINLAHRFPDVTELGSIDYVSVRKISDFSYACSTIALETWNELSGDVQRRERQSQAA